MSNLDKLMMSKFRSSFKLREKEKSIVFDKGLDVIEKHAYEIISKRLKPEYIPNDGKQTPMRNHPVFIAQHATATWCRGCLYKWHHIPMNKELSDSEVSFVVSLIMEWIRRNIDNN